MEVSSVLFLGTKNSSRSQIAEAILGHMYSTRFSAISAGVRFDENFHKDTAGVHPLTLEILRLHNYPVEGLAGKSLESLIVKGLKPDIILTLSEEAKDELSHYIEKIPGKPVVAHWGLPELEGISGDHDEIREEYLKAFQMLRRRIERFVILPIEILGWEALRRNLEKIGQ